MLLRARLLTTTVTTEIILNLLKNQLCAGFPPSPTSTQETCPLPVAVGSAAIKWKPAQTLRTPSHKPRGCWCINASGVAQRPRGWTACSRAQPAATLGC